MCTLKKTYAAFCSLVDDGRVYENPHLDFFHICRALHVSPASLGDILETELGLSGQEILAIRRNKARSDESRRD